MPGRAWTGEEKTRIVMESLNTNITLAELCRKYNVNSNVFYHWKERFIEGGRAALMSRGVRDSGQELLLAENERLKKLIGELTIANDTFKKILEGVPRRGRRGF
jgi:transposase-like protein